MTMAKTAETKQHFEMLDGLRGVAAAFVLFAHACSLMSPEHNPVLWRKYLAVYFFFMLSGFVIASAYERRIQDGLSLLKFGILRLIRLYPMIFIGTLVSGLAAFFLDPTIAKAPSITLLIATLLVCLPYPDSGFGAGMFPVNPPEWSLFFELVAYALFAIAVPKLKTKVLASVAVICLGSWCLVALKFPQSDPPFWTLTFGALGAFLIGNILWRFHDEKSESVPHLPFMVLAGLLLLICSLPKSLPPICDVFVVAIFMPIIILSGATRTADGSRILKFLGDISFPVYIIHWGVLQIVLHTIRPSIGFSCAVATGMTMSILLAWVAMRYFDEPVRKILNRPVHNSRNSFIVCDSTIPPQ